MVSPEFRGKVLPFPDRTPARVPRVPRHERVVEWLVGRIPAGLVLAISLVLCIAVAALASALVSL